MDEIGNRLRHGSHWMASRATGKRPSVHRSGSMPESASFLSLDLDKVELGISQQARRVLPNGIKKHIWCHMENRHAGFATR